MIPAVMALVFGLGIGCGLLLAEKVSRQALYSAHANGLFQGRNEREWEIHRLRNRVTHLEAQARQMPNHRGLKA